MKKGISFTIIKKELDGYILKTRNENKFYFENFIMQEYFEIKNNASQLKIDHSYLEFIETCCPTFQKREGQLEMFSIPTQWIKGNNAKELLDIGVKAYKENGGNRTYLSKVMHDIENK